MRKITVLLGAGLVTACFAALFVPRPTTASATAPATLDEQLARHARPFAQLRELGVRPFDHGLVRQLALHPRVGHALSRLPQSIHPPPGAASLHADFERAAAGEDVRVYLVNRTGRPLVLHALEGDIFVKLEREVAPGRWERVQPQEDSFCGNAYELEPQLPDGRFLVLDGWQPASGERATVRYALYRQDLAAASNAGPGLVDPLAAHDAACDAMAFQSLDTAGLADIARDADAPALRRWRALRRLGRVDADRAEAACVLEELVASEDPIVADEALRGLRALLGKPTTG
jgi:hypothetical protein